jgi:hypothetical protein
MKRRMIVAAVFALCLASIASAKNAKIYVFVAAEGTDGFQVAPRTLMDSARDLAWEFGPLRGIAQTKKRDEADLVLQITSREEVGGEFRVHAHITTRKGHESELTGLSTHQWKYCAEDIAKQLAGWARAHRDEKK